jgi:acyl dehydratase
MIGRRSDEEDGMKLNEKTGRFESHGLYFEDFEVGQRYRTASKTLFEADIVNFVALAGIHEELYTNVQYAENQTLFKRRFAPGPLTFVLAEGLAIRTGLFEKTGLALLETSIKLVAPLFLGDTFCVDIEVTDKRETSKPDRGIVNFEHSIERTDGTRVAVVTKTRMLRRRPADAWA